jgi:hypothetical protein
MAVAGSGRVRAEEVLGRVRDLVRDRPEVFGTGLSRVGESYAVRVMAFRPVEALPDEIDGVRIVQEIGEPPQAWPG